MGRRLSHYASAEFVENLQLPPSLISQVEKYDGALLRKMAAITVVRQFFDVYRRMIENAVRTH